MRLHGHKPVQETKPARLHWAERDGVCPGMARAAVAEPVAESPPTTCQILPSAVLEGKALCPEHLARAIYREGRGAIAIFSGLPPTDDYQGYHCGDPVPIPSWTQPAANPPGYRPAGKMAKFLPGKSGYMGVRDAELKAGRRLSEQEQMEVGAMTKRAQRETRGAQDKQRIQEGLAAVAKRRGETIAARQTAALTSGVPVQVTGTLPIVTTLDERYECGECGQVEDTRELVVDHLRDKHPAYAYLAATEQAAATITVEVEAPPKPEPRPEPRPRPTTRVSSKLIAAAKPETTPVVFRMVDSDFEEARERSLATGDGCAKCGGTGKVQKKRWAQRVKPGQLPYRWVSCPRCKGTSAPAPAVTTIAEIARSTPKVIYQTEPTPPVSRSVADVEAFMVQFMGKDADPLRTAERENAKIRELMARLAEAGDRTSELERMVAQRDGAIIIARREIERLEAQNERLNRQVIQATEQPEPRVIDHQPGMVTVIDHEDMEVVLT